MNKTEELAARGSKVIMNTYSRFPIAFDHGKGMYVWDMDGKKYLDFVAGIAVNSLGHANEKLCEKISEQCRKLMHVSNLYYTEPQIELAEELCSHSCFDKVFYCNSGAETIETALKICRKYATMKNKPGRDIICMEKSFHGRTYGAVTATGQDKYHKGLDPMIPGIKHVPFNNFEALKNAVDENTCGILLEPIQGEGGIIPAKKEYLQKVRALCDEKDIVLIFDEVQCGVGRTGELFAYQVYGVEPDGACFAKGLAGGIPIGAFMAKDKLAEAFKPGDHASTFGGNPFVTSAGTVVMDMLFNGGLLENVKKQGKLLSEKLNALKDKYDIVKDARGIGLMQGIELTIPSGPVVADCIKNGLLLVGAGTNVIRFVPALIVTSAEIEEAMNKLDKALDRASK
ncbi:MAG: aspartate aminotransferase family protein [Clostridia bacterium]|jgi:predicted acetylornithine/succinylornithine family transaminase|nr:aspartate aminotransferase family protein [Clostridia bacterium]MCI1999804.1 aspartate aminotransferase family protein [Clostridia bacterium]MCI2014280.1 aspartate aminotransferase family protein [Clostridia bacterium]